ncbi:seminase-like [Drosophila bipectinata]|uniref:seminase-like n=1 Tax=Drosophila bipectinata TaxID=42026 RepID=UPI001C8A78B3|nr:seminase-like [Drosophila bipectinata]
MEKLWVCCLLAIGLQWAAIQGQDLNQTVDLGKLAKVISPIGSIHGRVIGGHLTTIEKLGGYLIALRYDNEFICGGALIHDLIVLTAAHCFIGRDDINWWLAEGGLTKLTDKGERRKVKKYIKAGSFRQEDMNMDVAVVLLQKPMTGKKIGKLSLCSKNLKAGTKLTVSGWGLTELTQAKPVKELRTVTVPLINKKKCRRAYRTSTNITGSMFCASVLGKQDACTFDSGGPLVYEKEVCGIVSFGIGCASSRYPGVYTDVIYVKKFVEKSMKILLDKK